MNNWKKACYSHIYKYVSSHTADVTQLLPATVSSVRTLTQNTNITNSSLYHTFKQKVKKPHKYPISICLKSINYHIFFTHHRNEKNDRKMKILNKLSCESENLMRSHHVTSPFKLLFHWKTREHQSSQWTELFDINLVLGKNWKLISLT